MSKTPFMPLWVSDFLGDTLDLDAQEVGAYLLLLMAQWNRDGKSLPDDPKKLQRVARCGRNWPKVWGVIGRFFKRDDDGVYNVRLRQEAQIVAAKTIVRSHVGALGGRAKALKTFNRPLAKATVLPEQNSATHNHKDKEGDFHFLKKEKEQEERGPRMTAERAKEIIMELAAKKDANQ